MSKRKEVATQTSKPGQEAEEQKPATRPQVDIFEDDTGITVQADMPGVSKDRLDIRLDNDTLSIEGKAEIPMPEGMEALYADVSSTRYQRSFSLSSELDGEKADASLKDGVLILRIPKRERYQPRKIEVRTG
ncbi:MAG: Hsp20/alpha crystallin family protein [Candidatus Thiodiazotropha sp. (ex Epidulcina cf. delphinae)]|nr:Hsp20/alpha crystallin family protein [Candidatus Thiodiazotropha sp. (ex Epidulcina cf. delphinae)]